MATFETSGSNPRSTNGSALEFMNLNPYAPQSSAPLQQSFYPQQPYFPQQPSYFAHPHPQPFQSIPWQQSPQGLPWQQQPAGSFQQGMPGWNVPQQAYQSASGFGVQPQPFLPGVSPFQGGPVQSGVSPFGASAQQFAPVTTRAAELNITIPVQRIIGKHPQELILYLTHVVLPVLLDGLVKRSAHPEVGLTISSDLRECVAQIKI